jgi:hypothetical protein
MSSFVLLQVFRTMMRGDALALFNRETTVEVVINP